MAHRRHNVATRQSRSTSGRTWIDLLATMTIGVSSADTVHAQITAQTSLRFRRRRHYRLIVQSYDIDLGLVPGDRERPVGSLERPITGSELRDGVRVSLLELRESSAADRGRTDPVIVAWVEESDGNLDFDGRLAR